MKIVTISSGYAHVYRDAAKDLHPEPMNINFAGEIERTKNGMWKAVPSTALGQVRRFPTYATRREAAEALVDGSITL